VPVISCSVPEPSGFWLHEILNSRTTLGCTVSQCAKAMTAQGPVWDAVLRALALEAGIIIGGCKVSPHRRLRLKHVRASRGL